ncbi:C-Jun-amino-terminal kinase-interacting protein 4 [Liparis tanakae]|uniref:C-Jun-amino-terminal kinase-interacting protein 4 n=1 Tax=Liparis tanakae TaxID=230148 RepID=A0A4Z2IUX8_9TELE|nr:C-Jun-amino-terminal kinase-interacting protein 4 [Liparis tanakae]
MEYSERVLCGTGEVELDPNVVSEEAGKLYSELQTIIENHGEGVVESLVPIFVWVLEALASCKAQLRDREEEAESEKVEREKLLERYQAERALRKESQERFLELDDQIEQERRAMRGRETGRERRGRELEKKAREQADHLMALEDQKANLSRELSTLRQTHSKMMQRPHSQSGPPSLEDLGAKTEKGIVIMKPAADRFINDIISSTPELKQFHSGGIVSTTNPTGDESEITVEDEMREVEERECKVEEVQGGERQEKLLVKEEVEVEEDDLMEYKLRNNDSVFSELSDLSLDYVESVDRGASVRGGADQFEEILSQYEELKVTQESVDAARKALISRVVELTDDRSALQLEGAALQGTTSRLEGRMKEKEEEIKRLRKELEACQSEDPDASLPACLRNFSRSEMARVVMEKNQYKQRLLELQEAVRRSQTLRATQDERSTEDKRSSVWRKFNRLFGLSKVSLIPPSASAFALPTSPPLTRSPQRPAPSHAHAERRELYREIRSHIWASLGKRQIHGWSTPLAHTQESHEPVPEPKDVPVLLQLRLLDQRDSTAKLNCAVAVTPEISGEATCSVWVVSGPASCSEITVIDPARSNTVLDQFCLPPTAPALCICAVPPVGDSAGTVWIGTQEGRYSQDQVIAGLADGTLAFFSHSSGQAFLSLSPLQISSLAVISGRLWVGTGGGAIFSIPLSITSEAVSIPYCSIASAQLCYHGHRHAVRFIIAAPGCLIVSPGSSSVTTSQVILSGGEGYINLRMGDDANEGSVELSQTTPQRSERSHMIIWQNPSPSVPSPAL